MEVELGTTSGAPDGADYAPAIRRTDGQELTSYDLLIIDGLGLDEGYVQRNGNEIVLDPHTFQDRLTDVPTTIDEAERYLQERGIIDGPAFEQITGRIAIRPQNEQDSEALQALNFIDDGNEADMARANFFEAMAVLQGQLDELAD